MAGTSVLGVGTEEWAWTREVEQIWDRDHVGTGHKGGWGAEAPECAVVPSLGQKSLVGRGDIPAVCDHI